MILQKVETKCESNMGGGTAFSIKQSAAMFRILSSGLYSNKERAVIREVACNAVDANTDAGLGDVPIIVHLPSLIEPYFSIKDNGPGLNENQMKNVYTQYGTSTKGERNDQIGALGLGSKSPFSIIDSFSVTSITDGVKRMYTCYVDGKGEPMLMPFGEESTDEHSGVEVSFPVKKEDWNKFKTEAEIVFRPFKVRPTVVGNSKYNVKDFDILLSSDTGDWQLVKDSVYRSTVIRVAVQGNIEYPINEHIIKEHLSNNASQLLKENFRLYFEIGDLDISASREELGYDTKTIANIVSKLERMSNKIEDEVNVKLQTFDTKYLARQYIATVKGSSNLYRNMTFKYKNQEISNTIEIKSHNNSLIKYFKKGFNISRKALSDKSTNGLFTFHNPTESETSIFVYNDNGKKTQAVTKARSLVNYDTVVYLLDNLSTISLLGDPEYLNASEIVLDNVGNKTKATKGTKNTISTSCAFKLSKHESYRRYQFGSIYYTADQLGLDVTKEFFYIDIDKHGSYLDLYEMRNLYVGLGIIKEDTPIYGVNTTHSKTKKFKEYKGIEFSSYTKEKLKYSKKFKLVLNEIKNNKILESFVSTHFNYVSLVKNKDFMSLLGNNFLFSSFNREYLRLNITNAYSSIHKLVLKEATKYNYDISCEPIQEQEIIESYPLISMLTNTNDIEHILEYVKLIDSKNTLLSNKLNSNKKAI